jgi:hypothetical protein
MVCANPDFAVGSKLRFSNLNISKQVPHRWVDTQIAKLAQNSKHTYFTALRPKTQKKRSL